MTSFKSYMILVVVSLHNNKDYKLAINNKNSKQKDKQTVSWLGYIIIRAGIYEFHLILFFQQNVACKKFFYYHLSSSTDEIPALKTLESHSMRHIKRGKAILSDIQKKFRHGNKEAGYLKRSSEQASCKE